MTLLYFLKAVLVWLLICVLAVVNGFFRELVLLPQFGSLALPISGISLSLLVLISTFLCFRFLSYTTTKSAWQLGVLWLLMTLSFELLLGRVAGKSWPEVLSVFDLLSGNLFSLVLVSCLLAPLCVLKLKR